MSSVFTASENFPTTPPWDVVVQLCRRICVLRHTGRDAEAGQLHDHEFARAIAALPFSADLEARVQALFVAEEKRVAEAQALAEIIGPLIVEQLRAAFTFAPSAAHSPAPAARPSDVSDLALHSSGATDASASAALSRASHASAHPPLPAPDAPPRPVRTTAPSIADFIDDMLAQERPARRAS